MRKWKLEGRTTLIEAYGSWREEGQSGTGTTNVTFCSNAFQVDNPAQPSNPPAKIRESMAKTLGQEERMLESKPAKPRTNGRQPQFSRDIAVCHQSSEVQHFSSQSTTLIKER